VIAEPAGEGQEVYRIQEALRQGPLKARLEFGREMGLTDRDMLAVFRAKREMQRLQEGLRRDLEALAVMLMGPATEEDKRAATEAYLRTREETATAQQALEQKLVTSLGAEQDSLKMGALLILGVLDSGRRVLCAVHSEVSGGAAGSLRLKPRTEGLRQPLGTN